MSIEADEIEHIPYDHCCQDFFFSLMPSRGASGGHGDGLGAGESLGIGLRANIASRIAAW